jgi:hypothetical protein
MNPQLRILNLVDFKPVFELDEYESLVYARRWQALDDFELRLSGDSAQGQELLAAGIIPSRNKYLISVSIDVDGTLSRDFAGIIDISDGSISSDQHAWSLSGYGVDRLLSDRVIIPPSGFSHDSYSGAAETIMKSLVERHCVSPIATGIPDIYDEKRAIPNLTIETDAGAGNAYSFRGRFQRLDEALSEIAKGGGDLGFAVDLEEPSLVFRVAPGVDRTSTVIFSLGFDNVGEFEYSENGLQAANCAIVAGQGEQELRDVIARGASGNSPTGLARREFFIDARDLPETEQIEARADSQLQERNVDRSYSASIRSGAMPLYRAHWNLGDFVTVRNDPWQIEQQVRIFEVEVTLTPQQIVEVVPQFARQRVSIKDTVNRLLSATQRS